MEVAEYVQWTYYESIWNTIWFESNQDFISLLLFLDITFIQNLEQFLAVPFFFKFSFGRLVVLFSLLFLFSFFFFLFFYLFRYFVFFFFFFLLVFVSTPICFENVFFHFPRQIDTFELKLFIKHRRYASTVFVFALLRRHCASHYCCLSSVQMSFRFHLSVSFRSKPNSKRISTHWCCMYIQLRQQGKNENPFSTILSIFLIASSFFFLRKSLKFSLLRFYNKLAHHDQTELLFSSNSNLVTVLIVHEMLRCKSVESFGRSQYTTF